MPGYPQPSPFVSVSRVYQEETVFTSAARGAGTVSQDFGKVGFGLFDTVRLFCNITAYSGTGPTLTISTKAKDHVSGNYVEIDSWSVTVAVGTTTRLINTGNNGNELKIDATVGGTNPSITFSLGAVFKS